MAGAGASRPGLKPNRVRDDSVTSFRLRHNFTTLSEAAFAAGLERQGLGVALQAFSDESGAFKTDPYFVLGMVLTTDAEAAEREIEKMRVDQRYVGREFKYSKTDRLKVPFCKTLIDWFARHPDLEFRCIAKARGRHDLGHYSGARASRFGPTLPGDLAYNYTYNELLTHNINTPFVLTLDRRDLARRNNLHDYLWREVWFCRDVQAHDSKTANLLQLADLLTGSVYGDCTAVAQPVKAGLVTYLKGALGVGSLAVKNPWRLRDKFNIWHWRPPTAKKREGPTSP